MLDAKELRLLSRVRLAALWAQEQAGGPPSLAQIRRALAPDRAAWLRTWPPAARPTAVPGPGAIAVDAGPGPGGADVGARQTESRPQRGEAVDAGGVDGG